MNMKPKVVEGKIYNISLDRKKILRGWFILETPQKEYLVRQNSSILGFKNFKIKRKIYETNIDLKALKVEGKELTQQSKENSRKNFIGIGIALVLSALLRAIIPSEWIWGRVNLPISFVEGIENLFLFWILVLLSFLLLSFYRRKIIEKRLQVFNGSLTYIGKGYNKTALNKDLNEVKVNKFTLSIALLVLFLFLVALSIVIPFIVQERLFSMITILILIVIIFNGRVYSNQEIVLYEIEKVD